MDVLATRRQIAKRFALAAIATGIAVGIAYGSYTVGRYAGIQDAYFGNAIHTRNYLVALQCLRNEKMPQALSMLETIENYVIS